MKQNASKKKIASKKNVILPILEDARCVSFIQSFFADRRNSFQPKLHIPNEDINFLNSNLKRYFLPLGFFL